LFNIHPRLKSAEETWRNYENPWKIHENPWKSVIDPPVSKPAWKSGTPEVSKRIFNWSKWNLNPTEA
jgi:hypothetical protein